nr:lactate racemase domain-containing protein [uncultured Blautia sp.]
MGETSKLAMAVKLPKMYRVKQLLSCEYLSEAQIVFRIREEMDRPEIKGRIKPGMKIAVTCGSRGVANIPLIIKTIVAELKGYGADPFVVPAMGSHGGATAEGQKKILEGYGVTEEYVGCAIRSSMEVTRIGTVKGSPVYIDRNAAQADGIVVAGRIKPHTGFRGKYESGLIKMMVIGLGKQKGAQVCHEDGFGVMAENIEARGREILKKAPILCGIGIVENAKDQTMLIAGMTPSEILEKEPEYLETARKQLPSLPVEAADVLVVEQIGKDISGDGMDPNITGTYCSKYAGDGGLHAERVVILDLTEESKGCAIGMGMADFTTESFYKKINLEESYPNAITSKMIVQAKIPMILKNDREAIQIALRTCLGIEKRRPRIIRIKDTLHIEEFWVSEALAEELKDNSRIRILEGPVDLEFDQAGRLK